MESEKLLELITAEIAKLNLHPLDEYSGDTLSRVAVRLASYKAGLGRHVTMAKKVVWLAEKDFSLAKANGFKKLKDNKVNSTDSKELKILEAVPEYEALIEAQELEDGLITLSYNVHDLIDAIKSRLINLQMEIRESNVQ